MINISRLTKPDIGKWVEYDSGVEWEKPQVGKIKNWNSTLIFVVFKCAGRWTNFMKYTGQGVFPEKLKFKQGKTPDDKY